MKKKFWKKKFKWTKKEMVMAIFVAIGLLLLANYQNCAPSSNSSMSNGLNLGAASGSESQNSTGSNNINIANGSLAVVLSPSTGSVAAGQTLAFNAGIYNGTAPFAYSWSLKNATAVSCVQGQSTCTVKFSTAGNGSVSLFVTDATGSTSSVTAPVAVSSTGNGGDNNNPPPPNDTGASCASSQTTLQFNCSFNSGCSYNRYTGAQTMVYNAGAFNFKVLATGVNGQNAILSASGVSLQSTTYRVTSFSGANVTCSNGKWQLRSAGTCSLNNPSITCSGYHYGGGGGGGSYHPLPRTQSK